MNLSNGKPHYCPAQTVPMLVMDLSKRNDMFTTFLQQILSGRLLLVVIVGLKK